MDRILLFLGFILLFMTSCEGDFVETELDGKVDLTFPENVQVCPDGDLVGNDQIRVDLIWRSETNFDSYRITLENSEGEKSTNLVGKITDTTVTLKRGTLYHWFVSGLRGKEVFPSDEWSFYTQGGDPETNYIPYPALVEVNLLGENATISWDGKDEDPQDFLVYDLFISTENPPQNPVLERTELTSYSENYALGITYYVQVITYDNANNFSKSQVITFRP